MNKKILKLKRYDYILVALLVFFSGNPIAPMTGKFTLLAISVLLVIVYYKVIKKDFYLPYLIIAASLVLLFILQQLILNYVSWLAGFRYIVTIFFGGLVYYLLAGRFFFKFFIVIYYVSLISLGFFLLINIFHLRVPGIYWGTGSGRISYGIYTYVESHSDRNCGMFWEPGAFAGILIMCLGLNMRDLPFLWKKHRLKMLIIVAALLTTQSTTGYITFFIAAIYYFAFVLKNNAVKYSIVPVALLAGILVYKNADFLQQKIEHQSEVSLNLVNGEFSNSRFGSFIFDLHYIQKHPLIGNGFSDITRYADHPYLIGKILGNGNGLSNYLASLGVPFMFFYLLLCFNALKKIDSNLAVLGCLIILLTLFGEQWLNFSMYAGLMFINNKNIFRE